MSDDIYIRKNVPVFEAIYGRGLISLGGYKAIDSMFANKTFKGKTVLDIGSGLGGMAYHLAHHYGATVYGLELYPWMSEYATQQAPDSIKNTLHFMHYQKDGSIPIPDETIDVVCSKGVLTNIKDKLSLFQKIHQLMKQDGELILIDWLWPDNKQQRFEQLRMGDDSYKYNQSEYTYVLEQAGFKQIVFTNISSEYLNYVCEYEEKLQSEHHIQQFKDIISKELREELLKANADLKEKIEHGEQIAMKIEGIKRYG